MLLCPDISVRINLIVDELIMSTIAVNKSTISQAHLLLPASFLIQFPLVGSVSCVVGYVHTGHQKRFIFRQVIERDYEVVNILEKRIDIQVVVTDVVEIISMLQINKADIFTLSDNTSFDLLRE